MNWIKQNWKEVSLVLAGLLLFYFIFYTSPNKTTEVINIEQTKQLKTTEEIKTKDGEISYKYKQLELSQKALKKSYDSLSEKYKIKPKEVTITVTKIEYVALPQDIITTRTDSSIKLEYKDKDVHQWAIAHFHDSAKSQLGFTLTPDTITRIFGIKHKLFKRDELVVYEHHTNNKIKTVYATSSIEKLPKTIVAVSPYIGGDFLPMIFGQSPRIAVGVAITFPSLSIPLKRK